MKILMSKVGGNLVPVDDEAREALRPIAKGEEVMVDVTRPRNLRFHKKFFSMMNFAFDHWQPDLPWAHGADLDSLKNRDRFRSDIMIMAGYSDTVVDIHGNCSPVAKSISFAKMNEAEFERVYRAVLSVIWNKLFRGTKYKSQEDLERVLAQLSSYE